MSSLNWPFTLTVDDEGTHCVSPIGFPNCAGIGSDIETARTAGSAALSFMFESGIAPVPNFVPDLARNADGRVITRIRIELRG